MVKFFSPASSAPRSAKHEFKQAFLFNCTPQIIRIPSGYVFYTISGLLNFPSETGDVLQIQHLDGIVPLSSALPLFTAQEGQLFQEKEKEFILTCQNFICSTYQLFHPDTVSKKEDCVLYDFEKPAALFPSYPFSSSPCKTTSQNTYFNFCDVIVNPTRKDFGVNSSDTLCKSSTCLSFHEYSPTVRDNVISSAHWCNHSKVNLQFVPEGQTQMTDIRRPRAKKTAGDIAPDMFPQAQPLPGPSSDIWPTRDPVVLSPPDDEQDENPPQIFGD